jgi:hypothetical protein
LSWPKRSTLPTPYAAVAEAIARSYSLRFPDDLENLEYQFEVLDALCAFFRLKAFLDLNTAIGAMRVVVIFAGLGEKMAERFLPLYLLAAFSSAFPWNILPRPTSRSRSASACSGPSPSPCSETT